VFPDGLGFNGSGPIGFAPGWKGVCVKGTLSGAATFGVTPSLHDSRDYGPETETNDHNVFQRARERRTNR